jgi:2-oxoglutarate dehydrogenase complex dehydrogenase (E1) component-like enzyme
MVFLLHTPIPSGAILYDQYLENPDSVEASWRAFFQGFDFWFLTIFRRTNIQEWRKLLGNGDMYVTETLQKNLMFF